MGELGALFNPGMRHELAERQAKAARREEEGNARDGDLRIDLESGVAVINIPTGDQELPADHVQPATQDSPADTEHAAAVDPAAVDPAAVDPAAVDPAAVDPAAVDPTGSSAHTSPANADGPHTEDAPAAPPVLRPRGKRGLSASHR